MNILYIQSEIKTKLESEIPELKIENFPANFQDYLSKFTHPKGALLIHYSSSDYSEPNNHNLIEQVRKSYFDIYIILKNLLKADEACSYLEKIREMFTGFEIAGCEKMFALNDDFILEQNGVWIYAIKFAVLTPVEE